MMMIIIGLGLLVFHLSAIVSGGLFSRDTENIIKKADEIINTKTNEEIKDDKDASNIVKKAIFESLEILAILVLSLIGTFVFYIGALSVDFLFIPTLAVILLMLRNALRIAFSKNYRKKLSNRTKEKKMFMTRLSSSVHALYIIYILSLLVF